MIEGLENLTLEELNKIREEDIDHLGGLLIIDEEESKIQNVLQGILHLNKIIKLKEDEFIKSCLVL